MQTLKIKIHRISNEYEGHHFFILSKGYNAGKPLAKPCPNCFVIVTHSEEDKNKLFWICYSLWKAGKYIPLLVGSVIPFVHVKDVRNEITNAVEKALNKPNEFLNVVKQLQQLHKMEQYLDLQEKLITRIKASITRKFWTS